MPENTVYIKNCKFYEADPETLKCRVCKTNFIPASDYLSCLSITSTLKDCVVAASATTCHTCAPNKKLVAEHCSSDTIPNCHAYTQGTAVLTCQICKDYYYLSSNTCVKGSILNCRVY